MAIKVMNNKDTEKSERTTAMDPPKPPFLKSLDTKNWGEFTRELTHYKSLGGTKNWIEMVEASTLAVITDISDVPDLMIFKTSEEAAYKLLNFFAIFGPPQWLRSDQGKQFDCSLMNELCRRLGIRKKLTMSYNHQENGVVERINLEIRKLHKIYLMENDEIDYDQFAATAMLAINARPHSKLGASPFEVMFIRKCPELKALDTAESLKEEDKWKSLRTMREEFKERLERKDESEEIDREVFTEGELVLLEHFKKIPSKNSPLYKGPFRVMKLLDGKKAEIQTIDGGEIQEVAQRWLRKFTGKAPEKDLAKFQSKDEEEWKIEKIIRHRGGRKILLSFKVKWEDYGEDEASWLSFKELKDCEALDIYLEANVNLKNRLDKKEVNI
ncbi:hypothetical protein ADUPG1_006053 [Aduncisulcus paluster]|uniref:Integrase catalytic domain-containing protein n=1 Tax=Aduncisulcus paluster TaxID=2918883 RepID=A0ABQ5KGL1_9EUKA|nr:hypothetical protein ADUPG1_006053 [Aduncisulcus paluster]